MRLLSVLISLSLLTACGDKDSAEPLPDTTPDTTDALDADGDGFDADVDCDDTDASSYPGAVEVCDEVDNNCDGMVDEGVQGTFYTDSDGRHLRRE